MEWKKLTKEAIASIKADKVLSDSQFIFIEPGRSSGHYCLIYYRPFENGENWHCWSNNFTDRDLLDFFTYYCVLDLPEGF